MRNDNIQLSGAPPSWQLQRTAEKIARGLRKGGWIKREQALVLSISCVDAREMTKLNREYRGINKPTDVLSFEQPDLMKNPKVRFLGDLVLCREVVRAQARMERHGVRDEIAILIAHGVLHLLGYDHERSSAEEGRMAAEETRLLKLSGFSSLSSGLIRRNGIRG